jgi:hypothetical protein
MRRHLIGPEDVVTLAEIAEATGATLNTVRTWTHRYSNFPTPWKAGHQGAAHLYLLVEVKAWLYLTGREVPAKLSNP